MNIQKILLVGCPRSGTTILQAIISSHPKVFSLPETHFFPALCSSNTFYRKMGIATSRSKEILIGLESQFLSESILVPSLLSRRLINQYLDLLDRIASSQTKTHWLEKTPQNLWFLPYIEKYAPNLKIIHIEREAKDVIASIHYASMKYPESWGYQNLDATIKLWKDSKKINDKYRNDARHLYCTYESLVERPSEIINNILSFINLHFVENLHQETNQQRKIISRKNDHWTREISEGLNRKASRFHAHFNEEQQDYVLSAIESEIS